MISASRSYAAISTVGRVHTCTLAVFGGTSTSRDVTAHGRASPGAIYHTCTESLAILASATMRATRDRTSFRYPALLLMEKGGFGVDVYTSFCF
jgi:hypothetical protein